MSVGRAHATCAFRNGRNASWQGYGRLETPVDIASGSPAAEAPVFAVRAGGGHRPLRPVTIALFAGEFNVR